MEKKNNKKGFTLAELLIVVAIIAVLIAIAIPVFTTQLEKSKEATDVANLRGAYAAATTAVLTGEINGTDIGSGGTFYYDPSVDGSLASSGVALGQGTTKDGKLNLDALPDNIQYGNDTDAKGKSIKVEIASGEVSAIAFE